MFGKGCENVRQAIYIYICRETERETHTHRVMRTDRKNADRQTRLGRRPSKLFFMLCENGKNVYNKIVIVRR